MVLDYRGASSTPVLRLHAAVLQRELGSALVLEHEISGSSKKFLKFQGDKLKAKGLADRFISAQLQAVHAGEGGEQRLLRLVMDIRHLSLPDLVREEGLPLPVIGASKHLCG